MSIKNRIPVILKEIASFEENLVTFVHTHNMDHYTNDTMITQHKFLLIN